MYTNQFTLMKQAMILKKFISFFLQIKAVNRKTILNGVSSSKNFFDLKAKKNDEE